MYIKTNSIQNVKENRVVGNRALLGAHISIAGGYWRAVQRGKALGCTSVQIFTKNQLRWSCDNLTEEEIAVFKRELKKSVNIKAIFAHSSYLYNFASNRSYNIRRSVNSIVEELERCDRLNLSYLVLHPGSHLGSGESAGINKIIKYLKRVFDIYDGGTRICIETTAGQGTALGYRFEHLRDIIDGVGEEFVCVCFDTCHVFASGYDLTTREACIRTMEKFDRVVGLGSLKVIHLNDSQAGIGKRVDRHAHIGEGEIGEECFRYFMNEKRFDMIPKIIETPRKKYGQDMDPINLEKLKSFVHHKPDLVTGLQK